MALVKGRFVDKDIPIQSNQDPVDAKDLARKGYVDQKAIDEAAAAASDAEQAAKDYTDGQIGNLEGNPDVAGLVGALANSVNLQLQDKVSKSGDEMTGPLMVAGPGFKNTVQSDSVLVEQLDEEGNTTGSSASFGTSGISLNNAGGISIIDAAVGIAAVGAGSISLFDADGNPALPVDDQHVTTKKYVDDSVAGIDLSIKADLVDGKVPSSQLPSYVDDVVEYADLASFPAEGMAGKLYVAQDSNKVYRWSGSVYIEISASPGSTDAVPEGLVNLYYTNVRAAAAAPVQSVAGKTGAVTLAKGDVGLSNVDNTSDADKPVSTATATALAGKQASLGNGTTSQFLRGDLTWATVPSASISKIFVVGRDANTIAGCIALCISPSATNNYVIEIPPGSYTEDLAIPGNVHLKGLADPNDSLSVKITGQHTITGSSNNALNNRVCLANILFVSSHATTALLAISGTLAETEVQMTGCFLQNNNTASTAKLFSLGLYGKLYINNTRTRMAASGQGGTHFSVAAGGSLYTQYGLDSDGGTCVLDMTGQGYAQLVYAVVGCQGSQAIKIAANGLVMMSHTSLTNNASNGHGINMVGASASVLASHTIFNIQENAASYVVTGVAGSFYGMWANNYGNIPGVVSRNIKIGPNVSQLRYQGSLASSDISDFQSAARTAAVADAINDGTVNVAPSQNAVFDALALKQNSLGTGTTSQYLRGDLTWQTISASAPMAQIKHVAKSGVDATADGSQEKPYLTIAAAMASITDATPSKRYVIKIAAGAYTEASVSIKANVFLVGESKESVRITGAVSMNADFNQASSQDCRSGASMVTLLSACDFNWQTVTSPAGKLYFNEVVFGSTVAMYGHNNAIAQAQFDSCILFGALTISGINVGVFTNNICYANITCNQHPNGGMATILAATGGACSGTVRFNTTANDFNRRCSGFLRAMNCENLIIDGVSSYADVDLVSQGKSSTQKLNGGNLVALNPRISHDLETQMLKPLANNAHNSGDWGKQWFFNFAYVHASAGTEMYLTTTMESYDPAGDTAGRPIWIQPDGYGLKPNVSGGDVILQTAAVSGSGVRGKVQVDARLLDMTSGKISNLANGTSAQDAVTKSQLDAAVAAVPAGLSGKKETFTLSAGDITNGYVDCAFLAAADTMMLMAGGVVHIEGESYTLSTVAGKTRITFIGDLVAPSPSKLEAGDKVHVQYLK